LVRARFLGGLVTKCGTEIVIYRECVSLEELLREVERVCGESAEELGIAVLYRGRVLDPEAHSEEVCGDAVVIPVAGGG